MTLPGALRRAGPETGRRVALCGGGWLVTVALLGCASQGPLKPPSLHLPAPVRGLGADRVGDAVDLRWTNSTRTTDGLPLSGKHVPLPLMAEICREEAPRTPCTPLGRVSAANTAIGSFHDVLPDPLASGPPRMLQYRVRMLNGEGKGAAATLVEALAGLAPYPLQNVQAAPAGNGVLIRWNAAAGRADGRILLRVRRGAGEATGVGGARNSDTLLAVDAATGDPAGAIDTGAKPGVAQRYSVVREVTVTLRGRQFTMTGAPVVVTVAADAKLPPPAPPTGLQAVVNTLGVPEIDLVWQPGTTATGYFIYRAEGSAAPVLLTAEPVRGLSYTDTAVRPGSRYRYSVSSVNRDGATGPRSQEMEERLPDR